MKLLLIGFVVDCLVFTCNLISLKLVVGEFDKGLGQALKYSFLGFVAGVPARL
jgi:hypothetical protein